MAKYFSDERTPLGAVFEDSEDHFRYECEWCSYACSGGNEYMLELRADKHEKECTLRPGNGSILE